DPAAGTAAEVAAAEDPNRYLNDEDNQMLLVPFTRGFGLCGGEIVKACNQWLDEGNIPNSLGESNIVLIPKYEQPINMKDVRPMSLCNVIYKVLAKTIGKSFEKCS
ncbi:CNGC5-like protein, partial [Trifolium pratense]